MVGSALRELFPDYEERHRGTTHMGVGRSEYFEHLVVGWRNPLLSALTAALIVLTARRLGASRRSAWLTGLSYGFCTFAWPQARSTLSGVQTTFFLFLAFHELIRIHESFQRYLRPPRVSLVVFGAALGAAFLTRSLTAPVLLVLLVSMVFVLHAGYRRLGEGFRILDPAWAALPALAALGLFLWTNKERFGDPWESGYGDVVTWEGYFNYPPHLGLLQILATPGRGLLWFAPAIVLSGVWVRHLQKRGEWRLSLMLLGVVLAVLVPVSMTVGWHGAWSYGPRYALPLLPFLWVCIAPALDTLEESRAGLVAAAALLLAGLIVNLPGVLVDHSTHNDLATQAARLEWPEVPGKNDFDREEERYQRIQHDFRFAAPWAHWRILRHRIAGQGEDFPVREIFYLDRDDVLTPQHERERGFLHFAWHDFQERLGGPTWPPTLFCIALLLAGLVLTARGLDPDRP